MAVSMDYILLQSQRCTREERTEARADQRDARKEKAEANDRRYTFRVEANVKEQEAIDSEHRAKTFGTLFGWFVGTGGGSLLLAGPVGIAAGLMPAYKMGQIGSASEKFWSEDERKAAADANHHAELEQVEVDRHEAREKEAGDRESIAELDRDLTKAFAEELRSGRARAARAPERTAPAGGSEVYATNLESMAASRESMSDAMGQRREANEELIDSSEKRLQSMHRAERARIRSEANKSLAQAFKLGNAEVGMALSWCTFGISNACAQISNAAIEHRVQKAMEDVDRGAISDEARAEGLHRRTIALEEQAEDASDRIEAERTRLEQIADHQVDVLRKMRG